VTLPGAPRSGSSSSDKDYYRRRIDVLVDDRLGRIETAIAKLDERADHTEGRLNWLFGGLAVISFLGSLVGPPLFRFVTGHP
jgi:hypothetical protein